MLDAHCVLNKNVSLARRERFSIGFHSIIWSNYSWQFAHQIFTQKEKNTTLCSHDHKSNWAENKSVLSTRKRDKLLFYSVKNNIIWRTKWQENMAANSTLNLSTIFFSWLSRLFPQKVKMILCDSDKLQVHTVFPFWEKSRVWATSAGYQRVLAEVWGRGTTRPPPPVYWEWRKYGSCCNFGWQEALPLSHTVWIR